MDDQKYDIFISFKNTKDDCYTEDKELAGRLYDFLSNNGLKVFFSPVSLKEIGIDEFEKGIDQALDAADVFIAVGCSRANFEAEWLIKEWNTFYKKIQNRQKPHGRQFVLYKNMTTRDLPEHIANKESKDASDPNAFDELLHFIINGDPRLHDTSIIAEIDRYINNAKEKIELGYADIWENDFTKAYQALEKIKEKNPTAFNIQKAKLDNEHSSINTKPIKTKDDDKKDDKRPEGVLNRIIKEIIKGKSIRKYYFDNSSSLLIPIGFAYLFLFVLFQQVPYFSLENWNSGGLEGIVFWGFWAVLLLAFLFIYNTMRVHVIKPSIKPSEKPLDPFVIGEYAQRDMLRRDRQQEDLRMFFSNTFTNDRYAFLIGKSGSGKSLLIDEYVATNTDVVKFEAIHYVLDTVFQRKIMRILEENEYKRCVIIFDQFEKAFKNEKIFDCIKNFLLYLRKTDNKRIKVAFVSTPSEYTEICEDFQFSIKTELGEKARFDFNAHFLKVTEDEKKAIEKQLEDAGLLGDDNRGKYFRTLLKELCENNATMIDLNIARVYCRRIANEPGEYSTIFNYNNTRDLIWEEYFEQIFAKLQSPLHAIVILYALCKHPRGLSITDFRNITFAPDATLNAILKVLREQKIIEMTDPNKPELPYLMTHDRLIEYLDTYCKGKLFRDITPNIDFYCKEKETKKHTEGNLLTYFYTNTVSKHASTKWLVAAVTILYSLVCLTSVWLIIDGYKSKEIFGFEYHWNVVLHLYTILVVLMATYYIYHYLQYFAKIFLSKIKSVEFWICVLLVIWGIVSVNLALIFNGLWAAWLGFEWFLVGILHLVFSAKPQLKENTRDWTKGEGWLYILISAVLIGFNLFILWLGADNHEILIKYLGIPIFILFTFDVIRRHINRDWILSKIGTFVNISMKEKIK